MATIIERDVSHHENTSSIVTGIVGIVALIVIVGAVLYALGMYPFTNRTPQDTTGGFVNVDVNGGLPTGTASSY